jgi:cation diffusion facilitator CzcD-associated flavoprotein CzcO
MTHSAPSAAALRELDVAIVGAGFAGMYLVHTLRKRGFTVRAYEAGGDVGGTWYWNRYPGCRVDIVSMEYSYQFSEDLQQDWEWSEKYATQPELLRYARHVAERFDLRRDIQFNTRVTAATYGDHTGRWTLSTDHGEQISAQYFILATGILSAPNLPPFAGLDSFEGDFYHTGQWPHGPVDFDGRRVGMVGTGSSACQAIPHIAAQAAGLTVFQRTANYVIPAHNETLAPPAVQAIKRRYAEFRADNKRYPFAFSFESTGKSALEVSAAEREQYYEAAWARGGLMFMGVFTDILFNTAANATAQDFFRRKLQAIVTDQATAAALTPDFPLGCKRLIVGTDFYETFNRSNVSLVDVKNTPIERITARGLVVAGQEHELDAIVFATGFDAISGPILNIDIHGQHGVALRDKWRNGPSCYLGLMPAGFPNLFTVTGPGSPSVLSNVLKSIEQHVDFIADCITSMREAGQTVIQSQDAAEQAWLSHVDEIASRTVYKSCDSWYVGANIPGKPRVFTAYIGWPQYAEEIENVRREGYRGFRRGVPEHDTPAPA